ncbi:MAG TPA: 16S rRNA (adenine(1518)-N(6)/adenine(1519)-N(6))-dimethyltransferase RsmA [Actinomycetota bacterium]|nr:16S rRNA (adenine(1518)-N(6)/adenine(1519)-N(6))-dimethyltransferase RsmA [Actinomycetota bacterium]
MTSEVSSGAPELLGARRVRELLDARGIRLRKGLGQNFVIDPNTIRKMVHIAEVEGARVVEIGAGAGSLTAALCATAQHVTAVEIDERLAPVLEEVLSGATNVDIVYADALELDLSAVEAQRVVANLPYNIAATLVLRILEDAPVIDRITVMVQKEVGERLAAVARSAAYGTTSALVAYWAVARVSSRVSRNAFFPVPNVDSVIVTIERRPDRLSDVSREAYYEVVKTAFSQRRKTLRNVLARLASSRSIEEVLAEAGIPAMARAEEIDRDGFAAIVRALASSS